MVIVGWLCFEIFYFSIGVLKLFRGFLDERVFLLVYRYFLVLFSIRGRKGVGGRDGIFGFFGMV